MRKFETSQKEESRAQSADSSKAYRKPSRAFNCSLFACLLHFQTGKNRMQLNYRVKRCGVKNQNRRQKILNRGLNFRLSLSLLMYRMLSVNNLSWNIAAL